MLQGAAAVSLGVLLLQGVTAVCGGGVWALALLQGAAPLCAWELGCWCRCVRLGACLGCTLQAAPLALTPCKDHCVEWRLRHSTAKAEQLDTLLSPK